MKHRTLGQLRNAELPRSLHQSIMEENGVLVVRLLLGYLEELETINTNLHREAILTTRKLEELRGRVDDLEDEVLRLKGERITKPSIKDEPEPKPPPFKNRRSRNRAKGWYRSA